MILSNCLEIQLLCAAGESLQQFHSALNVNDLPLNLESREKFLPLCFTNNKHAMRHITYNY